MKRLFSVLILLLTLTTVFAQDTQSVEMADPLLQSGKIYVVVVTLAIIFIGLAIYLFTIDNRLKKIEKGN
ncbi:MAG: CcmD family protein [Sphingobacteriales bacterium]|nr:MAG: CcmD family protein [Sphingobacteriales bacterium]